jgi:8-oxo-dGTP diphosphatase
MNHRTLIGVLGLPINDQGKFLLALRNDPHRPRYHRKWEIVGGGLEFGETFEACLEREMLEEIGVKPKILFPYPIILTKQRQRSLSQQLVLACYLVSLNDQVPTPNHEEILDLGWFSLEEAKRLDSLDLTIPFLRKAYEIHMQILPKTCYNTSIR